MYQKLSKSCCYISSDMVPISRESLESLQMPELLKKSSWNWMKVSNRWVIQADVVRQLNMDNIVTGKFLELPITFLF